MSRVSRYAMVDTISKATSFAVWYIQMNWVVILPANHLYYYIGLFRIDLRPGETSRYGQDIFAALQG